MDSFFWPEPEAAKSEFAVPEDVFDLVFRVRGERLAIDHAQALAAALLSRLEVETCARIGVHGVHMAGSGNGWNRPEEMDTEIPLSRRARLAIRLHRDDQHRVAAIANQTLQLGEQYLQVGESTPRKLSTIGSLHARAVCCDPDQSEPEFLAQSALALRELGIDVARMLCGRSREIRSAEGLLFTRALMVADLSPQESVCLQQQGLGEARLLGCGLFVPHKGIDPVFTAQE